MNRGILKLCLYNNLKDHKLASNESSSCSVGLTTHRLTKYHSADNCFVADFFLLSLRKPLMSILPDVNYYLLHVRTEAIIYLNNVCKISS